MDTITYNEWLKYTPAKQWKYVQVLEALLIERQRLLEAIPPCPVHGECVPHAVQWVEVAKGIIDGSAIRQQSNDE